MASAIVLAFVAVVGYLIFTNILGLRKNIAAAKRSGLPYVITPVNIYNFLWLLTHRLWLPFLNKLPRSWTESWLPYVTPDWPWTQQFELFEKKGDVFLTISPGSIHIWLANAEAIHQVTTRREAFPKPLESYGILDIFGRNVVTTEGSEWKQHRKITSPGFNEKNNGLVFGESCRQAQGMLRKWTGVDGSGNVTIEEVPKDTMRLALHIISATGFGVKLLWPGENVNESGGANETSYSSSSPPKGHTMSFEEALEVFLDNLLWVLLAPRWLLEHIPLRGAKKANESFLNWSQYMNELFSQKVEEAHEAKQTEGMDIMGSLVRSSYGTSDSKRKSSPSRAEKGRPGKPALSDSEILGNAFVMIVAGHETTANTIHFSLMELAINPRTQRSLQKEIKTIFGDEQPEQWDYESKINPLFGSLIGAVLNEELRLMPPVIAIPKRVTKTSEQDIILDGKKHTLPAGAQIALCAVSVHRNPKYWPAQQSKSSDGINDTNDLNNFRPERWLVKPGAQQTDSANTSDTEEEDFGGSTGKDTSAQLFRPVRGAYIPFSEGARSCLGRRLAQIEVMAVLAVVFQTYSIELAVDEWASDEEVKKMTEEEKRKVYRKAQEKARKTIKGASTVITLKLHPGFIPVRLVRKGEERFIHLVD